MRYVAGYPRFQVSDNLDIYRDGILVITGEQKSEYVFIADGDGGSVKRATIICLAFHGPKPFALAEVAHWDGNSKNDTPHNLRWATHSGNLLDIKRARPDWQCGEKNGRCKLSDSEVSELRVMYENKLFTQCELSKIFGIAQSQVSRLVRGEQR